MKTKQTATGKTTILSQGIVRRILKDADGAVTPLMAIGFITALGAVGGGIDMSRYYLAQTQLQVAVERGDARGRTYAQARHGRQQYHRSGFRSL